MIVEVRSNGRITLELIPENDLEKVALQMMVTGAQKGKAVVMTRVGLHEDGGASVSVEK